MCIPGISPCSSGRGVGAGSFATQKLNATAAESQGIEDFCGSLIEKIGCSQRQEAGRLTLFGVLHRNTLEALYASFPTANEECIAKAMQGIITSLGQACSKLPDQQAFMQEFFTKASPFIGSLFECLFGIERGPKLQIAVYEQTALPIGMIITCLLQYVLPLLCGGGAGVGGLCPPTDEWFGAPAPPHTPLVDRGGVDPISQGGGEEKGSM